MPRRKDYSQHDFRQNDLDEILQTRCHAASYIRLSSNGSPSSNTLAYMTGVPEPKKKKFEHHGHQPKTGSEIVQSNDLSPETDRVLW